jgi:hypothetical protein
MLKKAFRMVLVVAFLAGSFASAQQLPEQPVPLNMLWRISFGTDYATTAYAPERDAHAPSGVLFYVPATGADFNKVALPGVTTLYRLVNPSGTDHMDSLSPGEGGYLTDGVLGYPWASQTARPGLAPLTRIYDSQVGNPWTGDHALMVAADALHPGESFAYYSVDGPVGYGYARYVNTDQELRSISGGGVTVSSNVATGCSVWEWWWNGIQFVNDVDYGRQISAALYPYQTTAALQETGDLNSGQSLQPLARHSSPCLSYSSSGPGQSTRAIPLDWHPENWGGGVNNPVIYPDVTIGKNLTLDWIGPDGVDRQWPVALYETVVTGVSLDRAVVEAPTGYLNPSFSTYYSYDPTTRSLTQYPLGYQTVQNLGPGPLALIIAMGTGMSAPAMGVYKNDPNAQMTLENNTQPDGGSYGQYDGPYSKWSVHYDSGIQSSWTFRSWIITDTLQNVINDIQQLYTFGVTSRD